MDFPFIKVTQGTKSNVLLLKPTRPEDITKPPEQILTINNSLVKDLRLGRGNTLTRYLFTQALKQGRPCYPSRTEEAVTNTCQTPIDDLHITNKDTMSHVKFSQKIGGGPDGGAVGPPILIPPKVPKAAFLTFLIKVHDTRGEACAKALTKTMQYHGAPTRATRPTYAGRRWHTLTQGSFDASSQNDGERTAVPSFDAAQGRKLYAQYTRKVFTFNEPKRTSTIP
ncbi:hypothetical protein JOM56_005069 [Amanita muscaria]